MCVRFRGAVKDTCGVEPIVVYLDFQAIQPISTEDLAHVGFLLRPEDDEVCVWDGDVPTVLKACIGVEGEDLSVAARAARREVDAVLLQAGLQARSARSCRAARKPNSSLRVRNFRVLTVAVARPIATGAWGR